MHGDDEPVTLGRAETPRGEVVLRRRGDVDELVVNGAFAMDSTETHSERELGRIAGGAPRVLVGGLGLGHTVVAVLDEADRLQLPVRVDVVELEGDLVGWAREGRTATPVLRSASGGATAYPGVRRGEDNASPMRRTAVSRSTSPRPSRPAHDTHAIAARATTADGTSHSRISTRRG